MSRVVGRAVALGPALAGDLPAPRPARGAGDPARAGRRGRGGPADRRPADAAVRHRRHPRDPPRAARLRRRAAAAGPPGRAGRGADPALRALLGEGGRRSPSSTGPAAASATFLLRQLAAGRQGRADRPHPGPQPAHRPPPDRRPDDRARRRHPLPGRRRGGPPRLALSELRRARPRSRSRRRVTRIDARSRPASSVVRCSTCASPRSPLASAAYGAAAG